MSNLSARNIPYGFASGRTMLKLGQDVSSDDLSSILHAYMSSVSGWKYFRTRQFKHIENLSVKYARGVFRISRGETGKASLDSCIEEDDHNSSENPLDSVSKNKSTSVSGVPFDLLAPVESEKSGFATLFGLYRTREGEQGKEFMRRVVSWFSFSNGDLRKYSNYISKDWISFIVPDDGEGSEIPAYLNVGYNSDEWGRLSTWLDPKLRFLQPELFRLVSSIKRHVKKGVFKLQ